MIYASSDLFDLLAKELPEARLSRCDFQPADADGDMAADWSLTVPGLKQSGSTSEATHQVTIQTERENGGEAESFICLQPDKTSSEDVNR